MNMLVKLGRIGLVAAALATFSTTLLAPKPAQAWGYDRGWSGWHGAGWHAGWGWRGPGWGWRGPGWRAGCCYAPAFGVAPYVVGRPVVLVGPPDVYRRAWIPAHWNGPYWVPGHWS